MLHLDYQPFGSKESCQHAWAIGSHCTKDAAFVLVALKDVAHFTYISAYVGYRDLV